MNTTTTLFNPYLRTCRAAASETPNGGTAVAPAQEPPPPAVPPAQSPSDVPPADNVPPATPPDGAAPSAVPPAADTPPPSLEDAADFSLDKEPPSAKKTPGSEEPPGDGKEEEQKAEPEYVFELPDDIQVTDEFKAILKDQAKDSGLDGKAAGKYVSSVIKAMEEAERATVAKDTKLLREDWGKDFNANMDAVKTFAAKLRKDSGLTAEDMAPLQSPKGYRLLLTLKQMVGEDTFVDGTAAPVTDPQQEARRMLTDPSHKYYNAIQDPTDPLFQEANRIYNKLVGYPS